MLWGNYNSPLGGEVTIFEQSNTDVSLKIHGYMHFQNYFSFYESKIFEDCSPNNTVPSGHTLNKCKFPLPWWLVHVWQRDLKKYPWSAAFADFMIVTAIMDDVYQESHWISSWEATYTIGSWDQLAGGSSSPLALGLFPSSTLQTEEMIKELIEGIIMINHIFCHTDLLSFLKIIF